jgi:hypothetical protein
LKSIRGADIHKYLTELSKPVKSRGLAPYELTGALHAVILGIFRELRLSFTRGSNVDWKVTIGKQTVFIETKIGNLREKLYREDILNQVRKDFKPNRPNTSAIVVVPTYPNISSKLNSEQYLDGLSFCPITELEDHLKGIMENNGVGIPSTAPR